MNGELLAYGIKADEPLTINHVSGPYSQNEGLKSLILNRGL
jgi:N-acetylneuraminate synthase